MMKTLLALGVASTLVLAPVVAFADEATTPPSPNASSTPGNGPADAGAAPMMHHHHHHHHHHHMMKPMKPMHHHKAMKKMEKPADAPK
jgi:hypothetical protein